MTDRTDPHRGQPVLTAGAPLADAAAATIMVHGRGADAADILALATEFGRADIAYLAPEAAGRTWYPRTFLAPIRDNEPFLSSALAAIAAVLDQIGEAGIPPERTMLFGFSQGACLATEFAARNARRYGGVVGLSGGLIGPDDTPREYPGSLAGTPVLLGCSDIDPHIPVERVRESAAILGRLDGEVDARIYPGLGHTIIADEIEAIRKILAALPSEGTSKTAS